MGILLCLVKFGSGSESDQGETPVKDSPSPPGAGKDVDAVKNARNTRKATDEKGRPTALELAELDAIRESMRTEWSDKAED